MKFTTFIVTAIMACSTSAATFKSNKTIKASSQPEFPLPVNRTNTASPHFNSSSEFEDWPILNPTFDEAVLECEKEISKVDNETRAKFEINGKYSARDACAKICAEIYPEEESSFNKSDVDKRSLAELLDRFPELNTTYIQPWKSQGLNLTSSEVHQDEFKGKSIPGAVFKQIFHTKELYSMASLAQSYWLNSCYDLVPYDLTYNTDFDAYEYVSEEFQTCKENVDANYEELKGDVSDFLDGRKLFNVKHGKEFWAAVSRLRRMNYSCGGDGDCFADALRRFIETIDKMSIEKA